MLRFLPGETREVADKALDRLRELSNQLPRGVVEQVERLHENPAHERRKAARVSDASLSVLVQAADVPGAAGLVVQDHGPAGLAILLPCPAGEGTFLRVRLPPQLGGGGWVTVEVKYCRKVEGGWHAGCELLGDHLL